MKEPEPFETLDRFIKGLDMQSSRWWQQFADEQDWRGTIGEAVDPWRTLNVEDISEAVARLKRSVAQRLMLAVRAAIEAGLVEVKP